MIEGRGIIESVEIARQKVEGLGGVFKSNYAFKDIIFVPRKETYNLTDDFLRVRVLSKNNWNTKNVILVRKKTEFQKIGKIDKVALRKEFDTEKEALNFIEKELGKDFDFGFEFSRQGWQYQLGKNRVFIEDIEKYRPSLEIEADNEQELKDLFTKLQVKKQVKQSMPEVMKNLLK